MLELLLESGSQLAMRSLLGLASGLAKPSQPASAMREAKRLPPESPLLDVHRRRGQSSATIQRELLRCSAQQPSQAQLLE